MLTFNSFRQTRCTNENKPFIMVEQVACFSKYGINIEHIKHWMLQFFFEFDQINRIFGNSTCLVVSFQLILMKLKLIAQCFLLNVFRWLPTKFLLFFANFVCHFAYKFGECKMFTWTFWCKQKSCFYIVENLLDKWMTTYWKNGLYALLTADNVCINTGCLCNRTNTSVVPGVIWNSLTNFQPVKQKKKNGILFCKLMWMNEIEIKKNKCNASNEIPSSEKNNNNKYSHVILSAKQTNKHLEAFQIKRKCIACLLV